MFDAVTRNITFLMGGFLVTLELTFFALLGGIVLGALVGLGRISKRPWIYYPVTVYVNFLRNIPLILVIFWFYFVMPIIAGQLAGSFSLGGDLLYYFRGNLFRRNLSRRLSVHQQGSQRGRLFNRHDLCPDGPLHSGSDSVSPHAAESDHPVDRHLSGHQPGLCHRPAGIRADEHPSWTTWKFARFSFSALWPSSSSFSVSSVPKFPGISRKKAEGQACYD